MPLSTYNLSCKELESSVETNSFSFLRWIMWRQISGWLRGGFTHIVWSLLFLRIRVGPQVRFVKGGGSVWRVTKACHMTRWPPCSSRKQRVCTTLPLCIMLIYAQDDLKSEDNFWHLWLETYLSPMSFITWLTSLQLFFQPDCKVRCCCLNAVIHASSGCSQHLPYSEAHHNFPD